MDLEAAVTASQKTNRGGQKSCQNRAVGLTLCARWRFCL